MPKKLGNLVLVVCFAVGFTITLIALLRSRATSTPSEPVADISNVPGIAQGEIAVWPNVENLSGQAASLNKGAGRHVFVVIFSSQCEGCKKDAEFWKRIAGEARKKELPIYFLSIDRDREAVVDFVQKLGDPNLPVFYDRYGEAAENFKISLVPQYLLLTSSGQVVDRWTGLSHFNSKHQKVADPAEMFVATK